MINSVQSEDDFNRLKLQVGPLPVKQALYKVGDITVFMSHDHLPSFVQTLTSAGLQACVEPEVSAGILRAALTAAASWDTESTMERSPSTLTQTKLPAKVQLH